jgi:multidrug transporter EmrE-like cation transporter
MNTVSFSLILFGTLLSAIAQSLLKAGTNSVGHFAFSIDNAVPMGLRLATEPHICSGITCYVLSLIVWIMVLSRVEVSIAYPMVSIGYVVNAVAAWYLFGESITLMRVIGIGVIILGVFIVARS